MIVHIIIHNKIIFFVMQFYNVTTGHFHID